MSLPPHRSNLPAEYQELDFTVEEENWNEYELQDGNRVRARTILTKIVRDQHNPDAMAFLTPNPIIAVYAPPANRGQRGNEPRPEEYTRLPNYEVRITRSDERWNRYRITSTGHTIQIRLIVNRIRRVPDRFNNDGLPFYLIDNGTMVTVNPATDGLQA